MTPNHGADTPEATGLGKARKRVEKAITNPYTGGIWEGSIFNEKPFVTIRLADAQAILATLPIPQGSTASGEGDVERVAKAIDPRVWAIRAQHLSTAEADFPGATGAWRAKADSVVQESLEAAKRALAALPTRTPDGDLVEALEIAKTALLGAATELHQIWGDEEGDEPVVLDAIAKIDLALSKHRAKSGEEG